LLPDCEALRTCRSIFPIVTTLTELIFSDIQQHLKLLSEVANFLKETYGNFYWIQNRFFYVAKTNLSGRKEGLTDLSSDQTSMNSFSQKALALF